MNFMNRYAITISPINSVDEISFIGDNNPLEFPRVSGVEFRFTVFEYGKEVFSMVGRTMEIQNDGLNALAELVCKANKWTEENY